MFKVSIVSCWTNQNWGLGLWVCSQFGVFTILLCGGMGIDRYCSLIDCQLLIWFYVLYCLSSRSTEKDFV